MYTTKYITRTAALAVVASSLAFVQHEAKAIQFDISSIPGTSIKFVGSGTTATFSFTDDGAGNNFQIDGVTGGGNTLVGTKGTFSGTWTLGPVTTVTLVPLVETAPVSGTGTLAIHGPGGQDLTANISWVSASSLKAGISVATLGVTGNITGASYAGSDPDLITFLNGLPKTGILAFTFPAPGKSLSQLVSSSGNPKVTTYSGNLTSGVPDSGTTLILLGLGLCGLAAVRPRNKNA